MLVYVLYTGECGLAGDLLDRVDLGAQVFTSTVRLWVCLEVLVLKKWHLESP